MAERVTESFAFQAGKVDRSGPYPVIKNVLLCGRESAHRRRYLPQAFAGDKVKVYEGRPVYLNHTSGTGTRRYEDQVGWVQNVQHNADGLPVGDIAIKPTHPHAKSVLWDAEHRPSNCSMSHVADIGSRNGADGWRDVYECKYVDSVDLVTSGATTSSMFSEGMDGTAKPARPATAQETMAQLSEQIRGTGSVAVDTLYPL